MATPAEVIDAIPLLPMKLILLLVSVEFTVILVAAVKATGAAAAIVGVIVKQAALVELHPKAMIRVPLAMLKIVGVTKAALNVNTPALQRLAPAVGRMVAPILAFPELVDVLTAWKSRVTRELAAMVIG